MATTQDVIAVLVHHILYGSTDGNLGEYPCSHCPVAGDMDRCPFYEKVVHTGVGCEPDPHKCGLAIITWAKDKAERNL